MVNTTKGIGFNFDNASRNAYLAAAKQSMSGLPKATSTG